MAVRKHKEPLPGPVGVLRSVWDMLFWVVNMSCWRAGIAYIVWGV